MSSLNCPNCGADLTASQSVRIAEYHFGHLDKVEQSAAEGPGFTYQREQADSYTIICTACNRLVRTLPLSSR